MWLCRQLLGDVPISLPRRRQRSLHSSTGMDFQSACRAGIQHFESDGDRLLGSGFLTYFLLQLGKGLTFAFTSKWLFDRFEISVGLIGMVMMFLGFGSMLGSAVNDYVTRKIAMLRTIVVGMVLLIALYIVMPNLPNLTAVTIIYLIINVVLGIIFPLVMGALTFLNVSIRRTISSLANSTMNGAHTLGAWLAGLLYVQYGGYPSSGLIAAACLALSLGSFLYRNSKKREHISSQICVLLYSSVGFDAAVISIGVSVSGVGRNHVPLSKQRQTRRFSQRRRRLVIELASVLGFVSLIIGVLTD
ncbi:Major Facilitator Superfamily protein [compost metagenome]